ncbi:hypothetical protein [Companilactobacillus mindensis]|nr:hypothetical protein [Companilactobacillus mindensis]GEO78430.1 hypothetical protein LMI01_07610 [Companilactobacillus mindensis]
MQTLDTTRSYYRRITKLDIIVLFMIIGLLFFKEGVFLSALLIVVYPFSHSKVLVSDIGDKDTKLWVRNMDWNRYRKDHGINLLSQYKSSGNQVYNPQA